MSNRVFFGILLLAATNLWGDNAADWMTWRGPNMMGVSPDGNPPIEWSETKNIVWKVRLLGDESNSTPVIVGDRIFFQTAVKTDKKAESAQQQTAVQPADQRRGPGRGKPTNIYRFNVVCLDRTSGRQIWETTVCEMLPHEGHHNDHGFASYSPITDGKLLWANFGSRGIYCLDFDGNMKWSRNFGPMTIRSGFGEGGSAALAGDGLFVVRDHEGDSCILALNKLTGETIWQKQRDEKTSWTTPIAAEVGGKQQIVVAGANRTRAYDVLSGQVIWECGGQTQNVIPTPVLGFGRIYCTSGFRGSMMQAIELGRTGDLTGTDAVAWQITEATPYVPSPLLYGDKLYFCSGINPILSCVNAQTGAPYYLKKELEQMKGIYASPVGAAGRVYLIGRNGVCYVLKNSDTLEVLAVNTLDDRFDCSPVVVGNRLYLKGKQYLYCIADAAKQTP
ncbi:MAG: PQQ-like beta-propeller repeat protein [Phycisphaerae bacterium]|nr:PQQ-like beta-propeller repeat protein [Phycisphaerae bacterium]